MMEPIKIKKILAVVFLTVLIWVWSDLAQDVKGKLEQIPVEIVDSSDPNLFVSFVQSSGALTSRVIIDTVNIKGPSLPINQVTLRGRTGSLLLSPDQEGLIQPGETTIRLVNIVKQSAMIHEGGVSVESCTPDMVSISVIKLARKPLQVRCFNDNGAVIPATEITPSMIDMYVPEDWSGDKLVATVILKEADLNRASGEEPIDAKPFVIINGRTKVAKQSVKVRLSEQVTSLPEKSIAKPKFCLVVDSIVQSDFEIVIKREVETLGSIYFLATEEARRAYQSEPYQVELVVTDRKPGEYTGTLRYRFPREFVEKNQIKPGATTLTTIYYELKPRETSKTGTIPN